MNPEWKPEFDFGQGNGANAAPVDFSGQEPSANAPNAARKYSPMGPATFVRSQSVPSAPATSAPAASFCSKPSIAARCKSFSHRKTDLLPKFISKKGRPFAAYSSWRRRQSRFEFEPRAPKTGKGKAAKPPRQRRPSRKSISPARNRSANAQMRRTRVRGPKDYLCEKSQASAQPCKFKTAKSSSNNN